nr:hypothetical protein T07F12.5 - Caenorhabditis elegans [Caenorhabditis elegans]
MAADIPSMLVTNEDDESVDVEMDKVAYTFEIFENLLKFDQPHA